MEPSEKGNFANIEHVSRTVDNIKRNQKAVEQGEIKIVDGYKRVTWKINKKGRELLKQYQQTITETQEESENMSKNPEKVPTSVEPVQETVETNPETIEVTPEFALNEGIRLITDAFNSLSEQPTPITIHNKTEKLKVLAHFEEFSRPMNEDFALVLAGIRADIASLAEA